MATRAGALRGARLLRREKGMFLKPTVILVGEVSVIGVSPIEGMPSIAQAACRVNSYYSTKRMMAMTAMITTTNSAASVRVRRRARFWRAVKIDLRDEGIVR